MPRSCHHLDDPFAARVIPAKQTVGRFCLFTTSLAHPVYYPIDSTSAPGDATCKMTSPKLPGISRRPRHG